MPMISSAYRAYFLMSWSLVTTTNSKVKPMRDGKEKEGRTSGKETRSGKTIIGKNEMILTAVTS
jgi:hypothetical protein